MTGRGFTLIELLAVIAKHLSDLVRCDAVTNRPRRGPALPECRDRLAWKSRRAIVAVAVLGLCACSAVQAHDLLIQPYAVRVAVGDKAYFDVHFGHLEEANIKKPDLAHCRFGLHGPGLDSSGEKLHLSDVGYVTGAFMVGKPGLYIVEGVQDKVVTYEPARAIRCAKAFFAGVDGTGEDRKLTGYQDRVGHPLEVIPRRDPTGLREHASLPLLALYKGKPLAGAEVTFFPRGGKPGAPIQTDQDGHAAVVLGSAGYWVIIVDYRDDSLKGAGYQFTKFSATLIVLVRQAAQGR